MTSPRPVARPRRLAFCAVAFACVLATASCSSGSGGSDSGSTPETTTGTDGSTDTGDTGSESDADESSASATLTMEDGTVYEITDISSCDTSASDPSGFPLSNGYDLTGSTADGAFSISTQRAGFDDENAVFAGSLEGDFDDEGKNASMLYSFDGDGSDLTADGTTISGTIAATAIAPTRPHGDATSVTVEANC